MMEQTWIKVSCCCFIRTIEQGNSFAVLNMTNTSVATNLQVKLFQLWYMHVVYYLSLMCYKVKGGL